MLSRRRKMLQHEKFAQNRQTEEKELMKFLLKLKSRNEDRMKLWPKNFRCHCCRLFKCITKKNSLSCRLRNGI